MNRHPLRWGSLTSGLFFLAVIGSWAVWRQDLLTTRELSLTASGVLIVLGVLGVAATLWHSRTPTAPLTPSPTAQGDTHEAASDPHA